MYQVSMLSLALVFNNILYMKLNHSQQSQQILKDHLIMIQRVIQDLWSMPGLTMIMMELTAQWIQETIRLEPQ